MSPPSYLAASPAPLISDADVVIVYNSEGEEFEQFCRVICSGAGDAEGVPLLQQIPQAEVTVEEFARALVWAQGPPTLEWCQNEAPCVLCAWRSKACVFDAPSMGLQHDTSVCLPCRASHKKCLILLEWQAACIAAEQGWDKDWVQSQLGKARKTRMLGEVSAGQVGLPQGGRREGVSSAADHGKQRASLPSGVGPSKRLQGCSLGMGIKFSGAPTFDHRGLPLQAGGGANGGAVSMRGRALTGKGGSRRSAGREGGIGVGMEHLSAGGTRPTEEVEEQEMVPEGGLLWAELEGARRRKDLLANEAASGRAGIFCWVWEHQVLLDSTSAAFVSIQDGLAQMPMGQPPELQQGMARVGRLLAGHRRRNAVAPGSWWEVAVDVGEALPGLAEVLAVVQAQIEIDLG
ncbi:hypothetical protein E4T56_gene20231 [Termitomyces sp. T112]|nr:hypothetical protein E4T56_gene20231 [Termitomyces sp. T112]